MQRVVHRFFYRSLASQLPWWGPLVLGAAAAVAGVAITLKPFTALGVLVVLVAAALLIAGVRDVTSGDSGAVRLVGACLIVAALLVVLWPGISIRVLAVVAGACLLAGGVVRIVSGIRDQVDDRVIATISGLARAIFGVLVLIWPGPTVLVVALLVGPAMIIFGLGECASALRQRSDRTDGPVHHWPPRLRLAGVTATLVLALGLLAVSALADRSSPVVSAPSFYRPPASAPDHPGVLVRTQPMTQGIPSTARAWRILYTTTRRHGRPALASGIVVESRHVSSGPRPVIAWAHATTGFAHGCAPSLMKEPFAPGSMPALQQVLDHGWIVVATDYTGLGTSGAEPYLVGQLEARAVLDSVRAVRGGMKQVHLANRTVVWGHSQGGGAALWAGILAPHYAPSADVIGVVALSPMTELPEIVNGARETPVGKLVGSYLLSAYSATYPDVKLADYVPPAAQKAVIRTAGRCVAGPQQLASAASAAPSGPIFSASPATGALGKRLTQNIPVGHIHAPLLIVQGLSDTLVRPQYQLQYINRECAIHQRLEYHTYKGFDHVSLLLDPHSPMVNDLLNWTEDRLQRAEQPPGCHTQSS